MPTTEDVTIRISAQNQASASLRQARGDVSALEGSVTSLGSQGSAAMRVLNQHTDRLNQGMDRMIRRGVTGLGALTVAAVGWGLKTASSLEQSEIAFTTLLGSADAARTMMGDLTRFAANTPFDLAGVTAASQKLLAYGFTAEDVLPTLTALGDASAGLGAGTAGIESMTRAIGQMQAKGRVQSEELLQLQEAGVPALAMLAKGLHMTVAEMQTAVTAGQVTSAKGIPILLAGMESQFGGLMQRQAHTLGGVWSNFKDTMSTSLADAVKPSLPQIEAQLPVLAAAFADAIARIGPELPGMVDAVVKMAPALIEVNRGFASLAASVAPVVGFVSNLAGPTGVKVLLAALLGYRALAGVAGIVTTFAEALAALRAIQAGGGPPGPGGGGPLSRNAAKVGASALLTGANVASMQGEDSLGKDAATVGTATLTGATIGSMIPVVGTAVGAVAGAGVGLVEVGVHRGAFTRDKEKLFNPTERPKSVDQAGSKWDILSGMPRAAPSPRSASAGTQINGGVNVTVNHPASTVDVAGGVQRGIEEHVRDREARR